MNIKKNSFIRNLYFLVLVLPLLIRNWTSMRHTPIFLCLHDVTDTEYFIRNIKKLRIVERIIKFMFNSNGFIVTADDGFQSWLEVLAPICAKNGWPLFLFVSTALLSDELTDDEKKAMINRKSCDHFLTVDLLVKLQKMPHVTCALHGDLHISLVNGEAQIKNDIRSSLDKGHLLGLDCSHYAIPFGRTCDISGEIINYMLDLNIKHIYLACGKQKVFKNCINRTLLDLNKYQSILGMLGQLLR